MNYEQFVSEMLTCTKEKLPGNYRVNRQEVLKNNNVLMIGLSVRESECEIAPVVYLEEYYKRYLRGCSLEQLADLLIDKCRNAPLMIQWNSEQLMDFQKMKNKIIYKLINTKENEKLLKEVPNLPILDFSIIFYLYLPISETETGTVLIRNSHRSLWKCPVSVLYECAKINTPKICPYVLCPLEDLMRSYGEELAEGCPILVLSNESGNHGASALLYPQMPKKIYEVIGGNYYLLPSSIHEFLVVPANEKVIPQELMAIVREVNRTEIEKEEFLSDQIYYFDGDIITKM